MTAPAKQTLAQRMGLEPAQLEIIRNICLGATAGDDVLELYLLRCKQLGADPFSKLLYMVKRRVKNVETWIFQSSIDLARSIAQDSGDYGGQLGPLWTDDGERWVDVWLKTTAPRACKLAVLRNSFQQPLWVTGTYDYYVPRDWNGNPDPTQFWKGEKAAHQLAKCVEMLALRKAFPQKLHGLYGAEEMQQADPTPPAPRTALQAPPTVVVDASFTTTPPAAPPAEEPPKDGPPDPLALDPDSDEMVWLRETAAVLNPEQVELCVLEGTSGRTKALDRVIITEARSVGRALLKRTKALPKAEPEPKAEPRTVQPKPDRSAQSALMAYCAQHGITDDERHMVSRDLFEGRFSTADLTAKEKRDLRAALVALYDAGHIGKRPA